jgi:cytochrome P450 family 23 subfamily A
MQFLSLYYSLTHAGLSPDDAHSTDYVHAFLLEKARLDARGEEHCYTMEQLHSCCTDLWRAGQTTTSTTLRIAFALLILHPEVQAEMQMELDQVCGPPADDTPTGISLADRPQLPYTQAVVSEVLRCGNIVPQNQFHTTTRDVGVDGWLLPKGTLCLPQISVPMCDPEVREGRD